MARDSMSIIQHLEELRRRLIWSVLALLAATTAAFSYSSRLLGLILGPVIAPIEQVGGTITYLHITEGLMLQFQLALYAGLVIASPVLGYQIIAFILPGLTRKERGYIWFYLPAAALLFVVGVTLSYLIFLPYAVRFLVSFGSPGIKTLVSVRSLLGFVVSFVLPFGLIFELPLVVALLTRLGLLSSRILSRIRKYAILVVFIVAAILTPPDVVSQFAMALPLYALFEVSILVSKFVERRLRREKARLEEQDRAES
ncbi:MAG: twin-arginine translocase subunit TatC [Symbiobacteriia bacterium]